MAAFSYKVKVDRSNLYKFEELQPAIKILIAKKEAALEAELFRRKEGSVAGLIFGLKQLGWKDTQSIEHSIPDGIVVKYA